MKTLVVVNERAGGGEMADVFRRVEHQLEDAIGAFDVAFTDHVGHATTLVSEGLEAGVERVVVGGGDGTLNEVVNGCFRDGTLIQPDVVLALLPGGTGGDFRRIIRINGAEDAFAALSGGVTIAADVGEVSYRDLDGSAGSRYFLNVASFGLSGVVDRLIPRYKRFGGRLGYAAATVRGLWGWQNPRVALSLDDGDFDATLRVVSVAVGNGAYFGGGMKIAPDALVGDGMFDVTVLGDFSRLELLTMTGSIYEGGHVYHPKVMTRRAKTIEARLAGNHSEGVMLDIDGEGIGQLPARFAMTGHQVRIAVVPGVCA